MATLIIKWQRLVDEKGRTCLRCGATETEIEKAAKKLREALSTLGIEVRIEKIALDRATFQKVPLESNLILVAEKPLEEWLDAKVGQSECCDVCGGAECRTVNVEGKIYETIPAELIVQAGLRAASKILGAKISPISTSSCDSEESPVSATCDCSDMTLEPQEDSGACCPAPPSGIKSPSQTSRVKTLIFGLVMLAAVGVGAYSFFKKSGAKTHDAEQPLGASTIEDKTTLSTGSPVTGERSPKSAAVSCGSTLDSVKSLGGLAADKEVVFIFLPGDNEESARNASHQVEAAVKMLSTKGKRVAAFTLNKESEGFDQLIKQFSVKSLPSVIIAGQRGQPLKLRTADITEENLIRAFVMASTSAASCGPQRGSSCCPK